MGWYWGWVLVKGADHWQCRQGTAHLRMFILGSRSFPICSSTSIFVSRIEISPSIFILWSRITASISSRMVMPWRESRVVWCTRLNMTSKASRYSLFSNSLSLTPLYSEMRQIHLAHSVASPLMISARKFWNFSFFSLLIRSTIPTSIITISTRSLNLSTSPCTSFSQSQCCWLSLCRYSESKAYLTTLAMTQLLALLRKSLSLPIKSSGFYLKRMMMLPAWQSLWMKLCLSSMEKKALAPTLAITRFRLCTFFQQNPIVRPSMNYYISTQFVDYSQVFGNRTSRSIAIVLNVSMLFFYLRNDSWAVSTVFREAESTGISKNLESLDKTRLKANMRSISRSMFLPMSGCLTLTATVLPCILALQTWLMEPEATGQWSNCQNISWIYLLQSLLMIFQVQAYSWVGACSLRTSNLTAIFSPMMSLL